MKITDYHAKYLAYDLTRRHPAGSTERVPSVMAGAHRPQSSSDRCMWFGNESNRHMGNGVFDGR
jgi:hypothetical protein